jgi:hypothetical protein
LKACAGPIRSTASSAFHYRTRNFRSGKLKVNDNDGNPVDIDAIAVWLVLDTAEAIFCVDTCEIYVPIQSESTLQKWRMVISWVLTTTSSRCCAARAT